MSWGTFSDTLNRLAPFSLIFFEGPKFEMMRLEILTEYLYFVQKSTFSQGVSLGFLDKNDQILKTKFFKCLCP